MRVEIEDLDKQLSALFLNGKEGYGWVLDAWGIYIFYVIHIMCLYRCILYRYMMYGIYMPYIILGVYL